MYMLYNKTMNSTSLMFSATIDSNDPDAGATPIQDSVQLYGRRGSIKSTE